jgi:tripeptide aminopeptidase
VNATQDELLELFVRLAGIRSPSRHEREMADAVNAYVRGVGLEPVEDGSAAVTGCAAGNIVVRVPGRGEGGAEPRAALPVALCAHIDTVPTERAPTVVVEDGVVRSDGETILGADDKAAVTVLLLLARDLAAAPPAAAVELVFTAGEEIGLQGAKALDLGQLSARCAFVLDSEGVPGTMIGSAPSLKAVDATFTGVAAHAGIEPEKGRSAILAAARAISAMDLGRIDEETTANVGMIEGGSAVNVVPGSCTLRAEARSRDEAKAAAQAERLLGAVTAAAAETGVDVEVSVRDEFRAYAHADDALPLRLARAAAAAAGLEARQVGGGGGSDANVFNAGGLPAVTLGVGFENVHSPQERIRVARLRELYRLAHALVEAAGAPAA